MTTKDSSTRLICPLTARDVDAMRADMTAAAAAGADTAECRLDHLARVPTLAELQRLLANPPIDLIITCRAKRQGGLFEGDEAGRLKLLADAASFAPAYVDVEMDVPPASWPSVPVILSQHDFQGVPADLVDIIKAQDASPAAVNKVAFTARGPEDALLARSLIAVSRKPTMALAMGEAGVLSRILAKKWGAFGTFAALRSDVTSAPGQPTLDEMINLYRWREMNSETAVYGVIGCPVGHSMSPAIHNAAFAAAGLNAVHLPLLIQPGRDNFNRFMDAALSGTGSRLGLRGLSVTIPHKENALAYVGPGFCDKLAKAIGAVNTITIGPDGERGDNTDYAAAIDAVCSAMGIAREGLAGRRVAVLGAGGAARAIVAALEHYRAEATVYNRTLDRAEKLAEEFGCHAATLEAAGESDAEIIINCTPIGMHPKTAATPLERIPASARVVFDTIYNPIETQLLAAARAAGLLCVSGLEMFVNQAVAQFEMWTGRTAQREVMRQVVADRLKK